GAPPGNLAKRSSSPRRGARIVLCTLPRPSGPFTGTSGLMVVAGGRPPNPFPRAPLDAADRQHRFDHPSALGRSSFGGLDRHSAHHLAPSGRRGRRGTGAPGRSEGSDLLVASGREALDCLLPGRAGIGAFF